MADLTQIQLPSGTTYDLKDQGARDLIAAINNWSYIVCTNASNTPKDVTWDNSGTTVTGTLVAASTTMYKIYLVPSENGTNDVYDEYVTVNPSGTTYKWEMFGNTALPNMDDYVKNKSGHSGGTAGDLAYKDSASGTVTVPKTYTSTFTGASMTSTGNFTPAGSISVGTGTANYTPAGSISVGSGTANYTPAGSVTSTFTGSESTGTISGTAAAQTFTGTGVRLQTDSKVGTAASFSGSSMTSTGNFTPAGSISVGTGTANYTPGGSISVSTAGSTTTIKNPTKKTVVTDMSVSAPSSTQATGEMLYTEVSGTKLILKKLVETTGDSITTSNVTVKNGDAAYSFSGTGAELKFSGTQGSVSVSGTTTGSVSLTTSNVTVSPASSGTATYTPGGTNASSSVSGSCTVTPSGSVSSSFSGTGKELKFTGTGTQLKFTGTQGSVSVSGTTTGSVATSTNTTENKTVTVS